MNISKKFRHPQPAGLDYFRTALRLPKPSAEFIAAEGAYREASDARRSLSNRLEAMRIEQSIDNPTKARLPTHQVEEALKAISSEHSEAIARDKQTRTEFDSARAVYREQARDALSGDIAALGAAIVQRFNEVVEALEIAATLGTEARASGVDFPGLISGASVALKLIEPCANVIQKMITRGS